MTQSDERPPIRSRNERARDRVSQEPAPALDSSVPGDDGAADLTEDAIAELRRLASSRGFNVRRESRPRRPRPDVHQGRVSTTCRLVPEVRDAMDLARLELNMNYSDMINAGVIMFLRSQNLRVDVDLDGFLPPGR